MSLDSQRLSIEEVFIRAIQEDPARRQAFLDTACSDGRVRTRVEALLTAHDKAGDFLAGSAIQRANLLSTQTFPAIHCESTATEESLEFLDRCDTPGRLGLLAHYEILDVLGRGGMGIVLRGVDVKLSRVVAIKVLAPQMAANATARQRFMREAQAAAAVSHDHVVTIHAVDEFNGLPYLVMECITGLSLQQKMDEGGALELTPILRIGMQIASGLAAAHAQGLVHRDIKPANILLENGIERVKITDFGLARSIDDVRITQAGAVYGTPQYMSPEQAQGERVDRRSDLFSLGSVMYAMGTGRPPFRGDTGLAVLKRVCEDTPRPIREVNPNIPSALVEIINQLLAKNPDARFQTANEVADLLSRYLAHLQHDPATPFPGVGQLQPPAGGTARPEQNGRPKHGAGSWLRRPMFVGAAILVVAAVLLALLEGTRNNRRTDASEPGEKPAGQEITAAPYSNVVVPTRSTKHAAGATSRPVKVFILAGDATMAGRVKVSLLNYQAKQPETIQRFQHLIHNGDWAERADVWIKNNKQKGNLTVGFGQEPGMFGPELEFGNFVGDHFDEQVLLIKTCPAGAGSQYAGGASLFGDFRSPSAGVPSEAVLETLRQELAKTQEHVAPGDVQRRCGNLYRDMLTEVWQTLANLKEHFPMYAGQGFEIAGFVWFQGWFDMCHPQFNADHAELLAHFIRDVRADFKVPNLPFVIGQIGYKGGNELEAADVNFRASQAAVAAMPKFAGNVKLVATDPFWDHEAHAVFKKGWQEHRDEWNKVGSDYAFLYLGSAKTNCQIGKAFGEAMIELCRPSAMK